MGTRAYAMPNRLAGETSPYLLAHAHNPVDWRPWGEEALSLARETDRPLLVSVGYSACHWCHVMERESFEDPAIAELMNTLFVPVKVDREERPDVDSLCMEAAQAMTGHGGWPLHTAMTPDGVPFWAGTYFPPDSRQGMPSWRQVLEAVSKAWANSRAEITEQSAKVLPRLAGAAGMAPSERPIEAEALREATRRLVAAHDSEYGGYGPAPKFPSASAISFLLGQGETETSLATLRAMAAGGMADQLGGGFARYSVDERWEIPHFEKMLYDNALLARAYLHGWQVSGDPFLRRVCEETLGFMLAELRQEDGGFAASLDADSEGVEGRFYSWTPEQVREALADRPELVDEALALYGIRDPGNFEGASVPVRAQEDTPHRDEIRGALYAARARRVWPSLDDKRVTSWNALAISALAEAGATLQRPDLLDAATQCATFVLGTLRDEDGRLLRTYNRGHARIGAFLEDHAFLLEAMLDLYEATGNPRWFTEARSLADTILERFADPEHGGFFSTAEDGEVLAARRKELEDTPIPSGGSSAALGLLRLAALTGESHHQDAAVGQLRLLHTIAPQQPVMFGHLLQALAFHVGPVREIAIVGSDEGTGPLLQVVRGAYRPRTMLAVGDGTDDGGVPLLADRPLLDGRAAAYVCEGFVCRAPVTEPAELARLLEDGATS